MKVEERRCILTEWWFLAIHISMPPLMGGDISKASP